MVVADYLDDGRARVLAFVSPEPDCTARDGTLGMPRLILPSVQVNMRAGHLPEPESNGTRYLKLPLNLL